jgi:hypothetical protein
VGYFLPKTMVILTIVKYKKRFIPFAFLAMAIFRVVLYFNKNITFCKLMGSGRNGTFDKTPDLQQWAILTALQQPTQNHLGNFVARWFAFFNVQQINYHLQPIEGHGTWDKKQPFGQLPPKTDYDGPIVTLTRATLHLNKLKHFWAHVGSVANQMAAAPGFVTSYGIGEVPWVKQATISFWRSKTDMKNFAYQMAQHKDVIVKTRTQKWYSEDMFVRFKLLHITTNQPTSTVKAFALLN